MAQEPNDLSWVEELLPLDYFRKKMFGGFAYYLGEKLILVMFESEGNTEYKGQNFDFEIWNGCMFPAEKENHPEILKLYPFLLSHPILPKWLYLPQETEDFETHVRSIMKELRKENPLFGSFPKKKGVQKKIKATTKSESNKYVPKAPQMFRDEPAENVLKSAKRISDLKNLGPETEKAFHKAGIKTAPQLVKLGWKKAMVKLCDVNPKNNHSLFAYAVIGAFQNRMWNQISEEDKLEARKFMKSLRDKRPKKKS